MNCKPGQLARVVAPYAEQGQGCIVKVLERSPGGELFLCGIRYAAATAPAWIVEGYVTGSLGLVAGPLVAINDHCLRPLGDPGEHEVDETLLWVPHTKPTLHEWLGGV